jgi:hypothetical protein
MKLSILFFYLRLFTVHEKVRLVTKICIVIVFLWTIGNILQVFLICRPFRAIYDANVKGSCGNRVGTFIAIGAFNWANDLIILIIPIPVVWKLPLPRSNKVA